MELSMPQHISRIWLAPGLRFVLTWFMVVRILTVGVALMLRGDYQLDKNMTMLRAMPIEAEQVITAPPEIAHLYDPWYRWDTTWYINIAANSYADNLNSIIFPPFYPLMIRLLATLTFGDYLFASLLISNICAILVLYLFYKIVAQEFDDTAAQQVIPLYITFPTAFFLIAGYSESLFIVLLLSSWLLTMRRRYGWASLAIFLATLTRTQGWMVGIPLFYMAYVEQGNWREDWKHLRLILPKLILGVSSLAGLLTYLIGMQISGLGNVNATFENSFWEVGFGMPWENILRLITLDFDLNLAKGPEVLLNIVCLLFIVFMGAIATWRLRPPYWLFIWLTLLTILMRDHPVFLHGLARYVITLFPLFIVYNQHMGNRHFARLIFIGIGLTLQLFLVAIFVLWGFVG